MRNRIQRYLQMYIAAFDKCIRELNIKFVLIYISIIYAFPSKVEKHYDKQRGGNKDKVAIKAIKSGLCSVGC